MKMFNNYGQLVAEIEVLFTPDGGNIHVHTLYDTWTGKVASQQVTTADGHGHLTNTKVYNGKLMP